MDRALLIINPKAGVGRAVKTANEARVKLDPLVRSFTMLVTDGVGHAIELVADHCRDHDLVISVGGDGTANEAANGLVLAGASGEIPLGVITAGTGNDIAAAIGMSTVEDLREAIARQKTELIDVIDVECTVRTDSFHRIAILYGAVGFVSEAVRRSSRYVKCVFGPNLCYAVGTLLSLLRFPRAHMSIAAGTTEFSGVTVMAWAGNTERICSGTLLLSPGAHVTDGKMKVGITSSMGRLRFFRTFLKTFKGKHVLVDGVTYHDGECMTIDASPQCDLVVDGELFGQTPCSFRLRTRALRVLASPRSTLR